MHVQRKKPAWPRPTSGDTPRRAASPECTCAYMLAVALACALPDMLITLHFREIIKAMHRLLQLKECATSGCVSMRDEAHRFSQSSQLMLCGCLRLRKDP